MSLNLFQTLQKMVRAELARQRGAELALVQEIHPHAAESDKDNYGCTVVLRNSGLILKAVPVAVGRPGLAAIPPVGSLVLVHFLGGDINSPVISGCFYNDEDRPPPNEDGQLTAHLPLGAADDEAVQVKLISGESRELSLKLGAGLNLHLKDDDPVVSLDVAGGKAVIQIERDGAVTVESAGDLTVKANKVTMTGNEIEIAADSELKLKGGVVNIN